jgi:hypothetical protein
MLKQHRNVVGITKGDECVPCYGVELPELLACSAGRFALSTMLNTSGRATNSIGAAMIAGRTRWVPCMLAVVCRVVAAAAASLLLPLLVLS